MSNRFHKVLVIEEDDAGFKSLDDLFGKGSVPVRLTRALEYFDAVEEMQNGVYDLYLISCPDGTGPDLAFLAEVAELDGRTPVVLLAQDERCMNSKDAARLGVADCLAKRDLSPQLLGRVVRYCVERAEMAEALRELAIRDELTGLFNRHELRRILAEEVGRSLRYRSPLSLMLVEIDGLRQISDKMGVEACDSVLQWVAQALRDTLRSTDKPARFSSEGLALVLPETSRPQAFRAAERIRKAIASKKITVAGAIRTPVEIGVTLSIGLAAVPDDANSEDGLVGAALDALQKAVQSGRNRTYMNTNTSHREEIAQPVR